MIRNLVIMAIFTAMSFGSSLQAACGSCCPDCPPGPIGAQGPQGSQGSAGSTGETGPQGNDGSMGPQGVQGVAGPAGTQGPVGPQGVQGVIGPQGPVGPIGPCCGTSGGTNGFLSLYSLENQLIPSLGVLILEQVNTSSSLFNITSAPINGQVTVLQHGIYEISFGVNGLLTPPIPFPIPGWSLGIYKNGVLIAGSVSGAFTISGDDICTINTATFQFEFFPGDIVEVVNTSTNTITAISTLNGSLAPITSVRLSFNLLKTLP